MPKNVLCDRSVCSHPQRFNIFYRDLTQWKPKTGWNEKKSQFFQGAFYNLSLSI